jgi:hypothetical protein
MMDSTSTRTAWLTVSDLNEEKRTFLSEASETVTRDCAGLAVRKKIKKKYPSCNLVTNKMLMSIIPSKNEFLFYLIEVDLDKIKNFALALLKI